MKILIAGKGQMGRKIKTTAEAQGLEVVGMVDALDLSVLDTLPEANIVIDFSHPANLSWVADYVLEHECPLVYGTTGISSAQLRELRALSDRVPVFYSANYSYGVAVLLKLLRTAVPLLKDSFDMELVETHHRKKQDAPSGTAKAILQILNEDQSFSEVFGREGFIGPLRGGTEAGEHSVHFFGDDESITITRHATDRQIFASGALRAADFVVWPTPGFYTMDDLIG